MSLSGLGGCQAHGPIEHASGAGGNVPHVRIRAESGSLENRSTDAPFHGPTGPADLVILNARIWTAAGIPLTGPLTSEAPNRHRSTGTEPTALAVTGRRIVLVGTDESVSRLIGPGTRTIDGFGRRVIPGLTDAHTHLISGGFQLQRINLRDAGSREDFLHRVGDAVSTLAPGRWLEGGRWSTESWTDPTSPNRSWLDGVSADVPMFLVRMDGHQAVVNSTALRIAGIDWGGPADPTGGEIERDPRTGEPTGILKESAMGLVERHIPKPTISERMIALDRAIRHAHSFGVTSVHDMSEPEDVPVFWAAERTGRLSLRVTSYVQYDPWSDEHIATCLAAFRETHPSRGDPRSGASGFYRVAGLKGYMDGSLGSRTAFMREPYADAALDEPYPRGQLTSFAADPAMLRAAVRRTHAAGLQSAVHAIGDQANHLLLDEYEGLSSTGYEVSGRHRVEHAQHLQITDIPRFASAGAVASMQPYHKADDARFAERALGTSRLNGSYSFRSLVDSGAVLVFGSDWPVVTLDPFAGVCTARNARTMDGDIWLPEQRLSMIEALRAYTVTPAWTVHREHELGRLSVGYLADLVILAKDPFESTVDVCSGIIVDETLVDGRVVYSRAGR